MKRPDPNASDGKNGVRPKPKPKPKAKVASEKEQEVAEALFDLANLAALAGGDEPSGPAKRKRARGKKDAGDDGGDGAKAAKRETENFGDAVPGTVPAGVPGGFPGAAANPLQALFSNPTAMSAMASHLYGAPGAAAAMGAGFGGIPGFDIQSMAAALGGAPPPPPPPGARPPGALKRCAAHVYIAHFIDYQQQMSRYSLLAKPMDPAGAGPGARAGGAPGAEAAAAAPPAESADRGGVGDQSPRWPAQAAQMAPPGAALPQGAPPGDFAQAQQFAALQALMGQGMGGGGMPFGFPGMPAAANAFAGRMGTGGSAGLGAADAHMPPGSAEAMAAMAAQMGHAQFYPPQAQAPPWAAPPAVPAPPAAPAAEAPAAEAAPPPAPLAPPPADPAPASEGAEAEAKADGHADPPAEANGDADPPAEAVKEELPAEGAAVPAPA